MVSSVQLYSWMLVNVGGRLVIVINASQFILNFWNYWEVVSKLS